MRKAVALLLIALCGCAPMWYDIETGKPSAGASDFGANWREVIEIEGRWRQR